MAERDDPLQNIVARLSTWKVPGFRSRRGWKQASATTLYGFTGLVMLGTCTGTAAPKPATQPASVVQATAQVAPAQVQPTAPTAARAPAATVTPAVSEEAKAKAVELLGAAAYQKEAGEIGLALEFTGQSLGAWRDYPEAKAFQAELIPQATAQAKEAQATAGAAQTRTQTTTRAQVAVATIPPRPTVAPTPPPAAAVVSGNRLNCLDLPSQAAAQAELRRNPSDPHGLDRDRDGIACESNRNPKDLVRVPR